MNYLLLATRIGLVICERKGDIWRETGRGLAGKNVTSVIAREAVILAGTADGVYRSDDAGLTWRAASDGLASRHVRWLAYHPDVSDLEFAALFTGGRLRLQLCLSRDARLCCSRGGRRVALG